jgi:hypothetical protein
LRKGVAREYPLKCMSAAACTAPNLLRIQANAQLALRAMPSDTAAVGPSASAIKQSFINEYSADLIAGLHEKQLVALHSPATEILYGGSAGGGKSHFIRCAAVYHALRIPGLQVYLFRRTHPELISNHMEGPRGFPVILTPLVERKYASINWSDLVIRFGNRSVIKLCHCQYDKDVYKYQGAEIHLLLPDELTMFPAAMYRFLRGRMRVANLAIPAGEEKSWPRMIAGTNPGNVGHNWVRASWVSPEPPLTVWKAPKDEGGMMRQFIPALLKDNPSIDDPEQYIEKLYGLGSPALVRAMAFGDWNIVAGGFLDDLWQDDVHIIEPFDIPKTWKLDRSFDWGSSHPFSVGWWAESDGCEVKLRNGKKASWPRGTVFRIAEWYGWNGKPNEGLRMGAADVAQGIVDREKAMGLWGRVAAGAADTSIFDVPADADSIATKFDRKGIRWLNVPGLKAPGSRRTGGEEVRARLAASLQCARDADGRLIGWEHRTTPMEQPGLFFFSTCRQAIRTIPTLPADSTGDDVDTDAEDHIFDEVRYRLTMIKERMVIRMSGAVPGYG